MQPTTEYCTPTGREGGWAPQHASHQPLSSRRVALPLLSSWPACWCRQRGFLVGVVIVLLVGVMLVVLLVLVVAVWGHTDIHLCSVVVKQHLQWQHFLRMVGEW